MKILCFVQNDDGAVNPVSKEAIALSQELKTKLNGELDILTFNQEISTELNNYESNNLLIGNNSGSITDVSDSGHTFTPTGTSSASSVVPTVIATDQSSNNYKY